MNTTTASSPVSRTLVLVADARSARLLIREANGSLNEQWRLYAEDDDRVRGLGQSPDTREIPITHATAETRAAAAKAFAAMIADSVQKTPELTASASIVVVAPKRFGEALREGFGPSLWKRVRHDVTRDETALEDDEELSRLVEHAV